MKFKIIQQNVEISTEPKDSALLNPHSLINGLIKHAPNLAWIFDEPWFKRLLDNALSFARHRKVMNLVAPPPPSPHRKNAFLLFQYLMTCKFVVKYHFCAMAHINQTEPGSPTNVLCVDVVFDNNISRDIFMSLSHNGSHWARSLAHT